MERKKILFVVLLLLSSINLSFASYPRAGYRAELKTVYHNVSGTVTIVDANTIIVQNFNYDGGGPIVYFNLGAEETFDAFDYPNGLQIGPELDGTVYDNNELIINLPDPNTLDDYNAISVWCFAASINFGSGTFIETDPALSWTFDNLSTQSYVLDSYEPNDIFFGTIGEEDPNFLLHLGKRYQVTVLNYFSHPLEILAKGASSSEDTVLLSMKPSVNPVLESDPSVGWTYDGQGTASFTLTQDLYDAMTESGKRPGYRCGVHVDDMRGNFDVCLGAPAGDLNGNCVEDFDDFAIFALSWLTSNIVP